jgi:hypothetical protein
MTYVSILEIATHYDTRAVLRTLYKCMFSEVAGETYTLR